MNQCSFAIGKFGFMGFTRKWEPNPMRKPTTRPIQRSPIFLQGVKVPSVSMHNFLGVLLDKELRWKDHVNYALQKGTKWVTKYCRLANPSHRVLAKYMRQYYISVAMPRMLYAADLFLIPKSTHSKGTKGFVSKLARVKRQVTLHITGSMKSTPTYILDTCADLLLFHLLVEKLYIGLPGWSPCPSHTP